MTQHLSFINPLRRHVLRPEERHAPAHSHIQMVQQAAIFLGSALCLVFTVDAFATFCSGSLTPFLWGVFVVVAALQPNIVYTIRQVHLCAACDALLL